jgi:hypothetical protein
MWSLSAQPVSVLRDILPGQLSEPKKQRSAIDFETFFQTPAIENSTGKYSIFDQKYISQQIK